MHHTNHPPRAQLARLECIAHSTTNHTHRTRQFLLCSLFLLSALAWLPQAHAQDAAALRATHNSLRDKLANNPFKRPLHLQSSEVGGALKGDIHAVVDQPFSRVGPALQGREHWCELLILHLNVKHCAATEGNTLALSVGRKFDQPLADTYKLMFNYSDRVMTSDYMQVELNAEEGPMGTSRYRIMLEVVELDAGRSFIHMAYSYSYGLAARVAAQGYLNTLGRSKVGFSVVGTGPAGGPVYVSGMRGVIERNTMRYFISIESYLGSLSTPAAQRIEKRLNDWHTGVERYPEQLHELEREEYLSMKRKEIRRQQSTDG